MKHTKLPVTLMVITLNEAHNLVRCLKSVPWASEILIVDSYSTDETKKIAETLGARVVEQTWLGFGPQKNLGGQLSSHDWILSLDADEALSPELSDEIQQIWATKVPDEEVGFLIPRLSYYLGRWIRYGGWHPDYQLRLYNRKKSAWSEAQIHESVQAPRTVKLKQNILHWVFKNTHEQVQTNNRYSTLQAEALHLKKKNFSWFHLFTKPLVKFVENYFWKLGFLDGAAGFMIASHASYSVFLKWSKLWEIKLKQNNGD